MKKGFFCLLLLYETVFADITMSFSSQTVREVVSAFWLSDTAFTASSSSKACFQLTSVVPDIVSIPSTATCSGVTGLSCSTVSSVFRMEFSSSYTANTPATISSFNYMDYTYGSDVQLTWEQRSGGCSGTLVDTHLVTFDYSEYIEIASTSMTISSDSSTVGTTNNKLTVTATSVTFPAEGEIIVTVPKRIGTTSMISSSSCTSFTFSGLLTATCDDVDIKTSGDEITILFTATEGTNTVTLTFTDFDNPFTTTAWPGFSYEVNELGSDGSYYSVSYGEDLSMTALTVPITIDAELSLATGSIETVDTLTIEFTVSSSKIAQYCDFEVIFPDDFGFDQGSATVQGKGCFAKSTSTSSSYNTISSVAAYTFTYPDTNTYEGGTFKAENLCPAQSTDLTCGMKITGIINPEFVATTSSLEIYLYDNSGGVIGQQTTGLTILDSQLVAGSVTLDSLTSDDTEVQKSGITYTLTFTPDNSVDSETSIIIDWPTDLPLASGCTATARTAAGVLTNGVSTGTCDSSAGTITFSAPFASNQGTSFQIVVTISTGTNQDAVVDAGTIQIDVYSEDDTGTAQLKDQYSGVSGYVATAGAILRDTTAAVDGGITPSSTVTYFSGAVYTFHVETDHSVDGGGFIEITLPSTIGTSGSGTNSNCKFEGATPEACTVDDDDGTVTIELKSSQTITGGTPFEISFGGIRNPRTFENSGYITMITKDEDGNTIDEGDEQFSVTMSTMGEFTALTMELTDETNLATTNYTISFSTTIPIADGDLLYITFPDDVDLPTTVECDIESDDLDTDIEEISCSATGQNLIVQIVELDSSPATGDFQFILMDVTNPPSTEESEEFEDIYLTDSDGYNAIQYSTDFTVQTSSAALLDVDLTQTSYDIDAKEVTYTFVFTPNSDIPEDAVMVLTWPDSITMSSKFGCTIYGPRYSSSLCDISTISQRITIERGFVGWTNGYDDEIKIEKRFFNNLNDNTASSPGTFTIEIFTDDSLDYITDAITTGLPPLLDCTWPCKDCLSSNKTYCIECFYSGAYNFLQGSECKLACDDGYTTNGSDPKVCTACDDSCVDCKDEGKVEDKFRCSECSSGYNKEYVTDNRCFVDCGIGYYDVNPKVCGKCESPCAGCKGNHYTCTSCIASTGLPFAYEGNCLEKCPDGTGAINSVCFDCESPCSSCVNSTTSCTKCDGRGGKAWLFVDKCYQTCPDGTTANAETSVCTGCLSGCELCDARNQTICLLCTSPLLVLNGECLASCPEGFSKSYDGKSCVEGLLDLPVLYFPHFILSGFVLISCTLAYFKSNDTLFLSNFIAFNGFVEGVAFFAQMVVAFVLKAQNYGAVSFVGLAINVGLNLGWHIYFRKYMKDPSFNLWQSDNKKVTRGIQGVSAAFSFKLTRLHFAKFAGLDFFRAGFTDPNVMWKPLVFFTIGQGVGVYSLFTVQAVVGLRTMRWGSQLYIMLIETLIISIVMTILQIIELLRIRQFLGDIYNPLPGETNATMDPLNPELRSKLLASIINKVKGQRGNFLNNNLDELLDLFGPRRCQSDRDRDKPEWGEDEREVKSWPVSPKNEKDYQELLNQPKFKPFGFMENIDQPDNVFAEGKPANPNGKKGKDFSDGWGQTKDSEFQTLLDNKKGDLMTEGDSDDEYRKQRAKKKSKRGRQNKYHTEINAEDDNQNDSLAELDELEEDDNAIKEAENEEDDDHETDTRGRGKKVQIEESPVRAAAGPQDSNSPEIRAQEKKEAERKAKEEEAQRKEEEKKKQAEEKKKIEDEKKMQKELEKQKAAEEKKRQEDEKKRFEEEKIRKKEEEKAKKEQEKKAKEEAKLKAAEEARLKKEQEKLALEEQKLKKEQQKKEEELKKQKLEEEKLQKSRQQDEGDLAGEKRAQETIDADNKFFAEEDVGPGDRSMLPMMTSSTPEGKRSDLKKEFKKVNKLSDEPEVQIPPNPFTRNFNESDILGQLERDKKGNVIVPDELKDQKSRKINAKGYLLDKDGNVIDKDKGEVMFTKGELDEMGEIPAPFCVEKFNFNPFTIKAKGSPKRGQKVNDKGWLTDGQGNIIEGRFGRVKFDKQQLTKDGDLPKMFNYNGKRFDVQDVMGDLEMQPNGDLSFRKDPKTGKNVDKQGRPVNERGYLVDHEGNVISKNGQKIFDAEHLENGEIPKIFPFTKFNAKNVTGNFEFDPVGVPILGRDKNGNFIDNDGRRVNEKGYLIDNQGNVIDKRTDVVMFNNSVLDREGDIPKVFKTGLLRSDTNSSLQKIISDIERGNDQSEFDHDERVLNSHMRAHGTPEDGGEGHKRKNSGETSEGSVMGITPSDYNFLNQRFEPDRENIGEVIEEENEDGERRKKRIKKKQQPQKTYVDPRGVEMATAYGGPIPKPKPRKTVLGQKPIVNDKAKERLSKLANSIAGFQGDETHSRRGSQANKTAEGFLDHHQREEQLKKRQMDKINKKKLAAQAKKARAEGMDQPDFEKMFGKDIDQFLEDSDWEIESFERMSQFSRGSARSFSDPKKLRGLEQIYLQRLEASQKKHGVSKKGPAKFRQLQDRTVDPAEAFNEDSSQKNFGLPPMNQKAISMQKGSSKNSDQGNLFAGKAKMYQKEGGWMQN